jgi:membrane fusion protein, copper/silver efflux system
VERGRTAGTLRLYGRVAADENRMYVLNSSTEGFVREISAVTTGTLVKKGEWLATVYSYDYRQPVQSFLTTLEVVDAAKKRGVDSHELTPAEESSHFAERRLQGIGMSAAQIDDIRRTRVAPLDVKIAAPADGFVIARNATRGQKFDKGAEWYRIANLDRVWIVADVPEADAPTVRPGTHARVWLPGRYKAIDAAVMQILPQVDATTRTLRVRLEAANPGYLLRPEMFVDVELPIASPPALTVAADAVLDSGENKIVFVQRGEGVFEPRQVETGARVGDQVEIVSGLTAGERIVVSGNFLIGSEARLKGSMPLASTVAARSRRAIDPSCGMEIDAAQAEASGHTAAYRQVTYHFCSDQCKRKFLAAPGKYLHERGEHHELAANAAMVNPVPAAHHD